MFAAMRLNLFVWSASTTRTNSRKQANYRAMTEDDDEERPGAKLLENKGAKPSSRSRIASRAKVSQSRK